jgi:hypothetical protein
MARKKIDVSELIPLIREVIRAEMARIRDEVFENQATMHSSILPAGSGAGLSVTTAEVCRRWGRSRSTLCRLVRDGKLTPVGKYRQSFTFRLGDVTCLFGPPVL